MKAVSCVFRNKPEYLLVKWFQNSTGYKKESDFTLYKSEKETLPW